MAKEKTQTKQFLEALSVLQWVLSFLFLGKIPSRSMNAHSASLMSIASLHCSTMCGSVRFLTCPHMLCISRAGMYILDGVSYVYLTVAALRSELHLADGGLEHP